MSFWINPSDPVLRSPLSRPRCCHKNARPKANARHPPLIRLIFVSRAREGDNTLAPNQPRTIYEVYGCMLTGTSGEELERVPEVSSSIRKAHWLSYQSSIRSGLHDPQIVLLPYGLDLLLKECMGNSDDKHLWFSRLSCPLGYLSFIWSPSATELLHMAPRSWGMHQGLQLGKRFDGWA